MMQVVIPMSGLGSRFLAAGYTDPKPLIEVMGKPMIEWVTRMFKDETDFTFICRNEHLDTTPLRDVLQRIMPTGKIIGIPGHKLGPVYAVSQCLDALDMSRPVLVSYCDYYMHWDYAAFKQTVMTQNYAGAVPCYTGFHPHLMYPGNLYAGCRVDAQDQLLEIREKFSFTEESTQSYHSPGVYYFKSGELLAHYFKKMRAEGQALNGEYYVSLVYSLLLKDQLPVWAPANVSHFCQWGTPEDLKEFEFWMSEIGGKSI